MFGAPLNPTLSALSSIFEALAPGSYLAVLRLSIKYLMSSCDHACSLHAVTNAGAMRVTPSGKLSQQQHHGINTTTAHYVQKLKQLSSTARCGIREAASPTDIRLMRTVS